MHRRQTVPSHRRKHRLHKLRQHRRLTAQQRIRLRRAHQRQPGPRRQPVDKIAAGTRKRQQMLHIQRQCLRDCHLRRRLLQRQHILARQQRTGRSEQLAAVTPAQHLHLAGRIRITERKTHQKTVHLRLRQGKRPNLFQRILRGNHKKRRRQRMGTVIHRHLPLLHRFQQRRLTLRRSTVYLIGKQQLREHRPLMKDQRLRLRFQRRKTDHIGRQQIGRELNTAEIQPKRGSERLGKRRLARPRQILQQQMPAREQTRCRQRNHLFLADNNRTQLGKCLLQTLADIGG